MLCQMLCQCYQVSSDPSPSPILLPSCVIGAISWAVEERVRLANVNTLIPAGCPPNRLFVPEVLHSQVAHCIGHWAHDSLFACHPGVKWTSSLITQRFWWPTLEKEVREYVAA